jgi:hypothetical protein
MVWFVGLAMEVGTSVRVVANDHTLGLPLTDPDAADIGSEGVVVDLSEVDYEGDDRDNFTWVEFDVPYQTVGGETVLVGGTLIGYEKGIPYLEAVR